MKRASICSAPVVRFTPKLFLCTLNRSVIFLVSEIRWLRSLTSQSKCNFKWHVIIQRNMNPQQASSPQPAHQCGLHRPVLTSHPRLSKCKGVQREMLWSPAEVVQGIRDLTGTEALTGLCITWTDTSSACTHLLLGSVARRFHFLRLLV